MVNLLNLNGPEDVYELINDVADGARGGSQEGIVLRQLEMMRPYRQEILAWAQIDETAEKLQAALRYLLEMADLCGYLGRAQEEKQLHKQAIRLAKQILELTGDLEDFQQLCSVMHRQLNLMWYLEDEMGGKLACTRFLDSAQMYYAAHREWNRQEFLEELARIYGANAKWYGVYDRNGAWHALCTMRAQRIRLYLDQLRSREDLVNLRGSLFDAAARYMDEHSKYWNPREARACLLRALSLMKRNPKLPHTRYLLPSCYDRIARTYVAEEEYARIKTKRVYTDERRIADRTKSRDYQLKALDAWLAFLRYQQRTGNKMEVTAMCLRECYEALAEDFGCLPGEKNEKKAEKYRQKAAEVKE